MKSRVYFSIDAASVVNALCYALRSGRIPREIYLDNKNSLPLNSSRLKGQKLGIKLIFCRLYNLKGRGNIERYYTTLYQELITLEEFRFT